MTQTHKLPKFILFKTCILEMKEATHHDMKRMRRTQNKETARKNKQSTLPDQTEGERQPPYEHQLSQVFGFEG